MKKFVVILLVLCLFIPVSNVSAETLNQYIAKADAALKAERSKIAQKEMTVLHREKIKLKNCLI